MSARSVGKRVTLADVAREAGVSIQTASHVLADNRTVRLPETTRAKVREAAHRVGYIPNRLAQAMKRGKTNVVSIWMPVDRPVVTYSRAIRHLYQHARTAGYEVMISGLDTLGALTPDGPVPSLWPVDAIISLDAGKAVQTFRSATRDSRVPISILGYESVENSDSVTWDAASAARNGVARLIKSGAERIVFLTLDWIFRDFPREQRRRGYSEAMEEAGFEPSFATSGGETSSAATEAIALYLESNPVPDAIFAFTDTLAIGAIRALTQKGVRVPEDCQVLGFGDYPEGEDSRVPVSTLRIPIGRVVDQAWTWLFERMGDPTIPTRFASMEMEYVKRDSTLI